MAVVAFLDRRRRGAGHGDLACHLVVVLVVDRRPVARDDDPVAFVEIGDPLGQRRQRQGVGTEIGFPVTVADHQGRAQPGADQQLRMGAEGDREGEGAAQLR